MLLVYGTYLIGQIIEVELGLLSPLLPEVRVVHVDVRRLVGYEAGLGEGGALPLTLQLDHVGPLLQDLVYVLLTEPVNKRPHNSHSWHQWNIVSNMLRRGHLYYYNVLLLGPVYASPSTALHSSVPVTIFSCSVIPSMRSQKIRPPKAPFCFISSAEVR